MELTPRESEDRGDFQQELRVVSPSADQFLGLWLGLICAIRPYNSLGEEFRLRRHTSSQEMCKSEIKGPIIFLDFLVFEEHKNLEEPLSVLFFVKSIGCIWHTPCPKAPKQVS